MRRIPSLDGLRAISVMLVILGHLQRRNLIYIPFFGDYALLGVRIFFVLSGFLITNLLLHEQECTKPISLREFYIRRAYRIFPAAAVYLAIASLFFWRETPWYQIAIAALYMANMASGLHWSFGHLWTLSIEEQFYLLWPFVLRRWHKNKIAILIAVSIAAPFFQTLMLALHIHRNLLPGYADQLATGCLLAIFAPRLPKIKGYVGLAMAAAIFLIPGFPAVTASRTVFELFVLNPLLNISIAGVVLHVIDSPYGFLNWTPVAWVGKISYSLYLWQEIFCYNPKLHYGYFLILPCLGCASLSYYLVEQPMLRLRDKRTRKVKGLPKGTVQPEAASVA